MSSANRCIVIVFSTFILFFTAAPVVGQTTWYVDDNAPNDPGPGDPTVSDPTEDGTAAHPFDAIQEAIDATIEGDEVVVLDGVYTGAGNKGIDYNGKGITVRSENGPDNCIIDCEGYGRGFYFHSGEDHAAVVEGFSITDGWSSQHGGGIYCYNSDPLITNCTIMGNMADKGGGGIYCHDSNPSITNCTIVGNTADSGGGIDCLSGSPAISNCTIAENWARDSSGGGISCSSSNPAIADCNIAGNTARNDGGGINCVACSPTITNCIIAGNLAGEDGGGAYCLSHSPAFTNCIIAGNTAGDDGGGIRCNSGSPTITNCILWGDAPQEISSSPSSSPVVTYCDVQEGWTGEGNIDIDPGFAFVDDYHLMPGSSCIDAGTNTPSGGLPPDDLDGNLRPVDGDEDELAVADMGAYEFNPDAPSIALSTTTIDFFVPVGGPNPTGQELGIRNCGGGTLDWTVSDDCPWLEVDRQEGSSSGQVNTMTLSVNATSLTHGKYEYGLDVADPGAVNSPRTVLVALHVGTTWYVDDDAPNDPGPDDPTISDPAEDGTAAHPFDAIQEALDATTEGDEVIVLDGRYRGDGNRNLDYNGKGIVVRSENGPENCVIDCDEGGPGFNFHSSEGPSAVVDGFSITNGWGDDDGGGIYCGGSNPTITNCTIMGNTANKGGGIYCTSSDLTISNCTIKGNTATRKGGGIYCDNGTSAITQCTITNNSTGYDGAGIYCDSSIPAITNCIIASNTAGGDGSGIYCDTSSHPTITNCTIARNTGSGDDGGIHCASTSYPMITNCILRGNVPQDIFAPSGTPIVTYCNVQGGWAGDGNIDSDPGFAFVDDYHLMPGSTCIDAGTNTPPGGLPPDDFEGSLRPLDGNGDETAVADMGAYEFNPEAPSMAVSATTIEFFAPLEGPNPEDYELKIRNCGNGTLNWGILEDCPWLEADPPSGTSSGQINTTYLKVNAASLVHGEYKHLLTLTDPAAGNSPRTVRVLLHVHTTLRVPAEYATIQEAIDATSVSHDVVLVADGTYTGIGNRDLDFGGKEIAVRSENGAEDCIIDAENNGRGFMFHSGEGPRSVVDGFSIINGESGAGGGIICLSSSPTILNCVIEGNSTQSIGGGIFCHYCNPTITRCTISENTADRIGGGICCHASNPKITECTITGNVALDGEGGGISSWNVNNLTITDCTILGNTAVEGGGIFCDGPSSLTITNCRITGNTATFRSGGIFCEAYSSPTITTCTIADNTAEYGMGGGILCYEGSYPTITDCTITGNKAEDSNGGGGLYCGYDSSPMIEHCTIMNNTSERSDGGGIGCYVSSPMITHCTIAGNTADYDGGGLSCDYSSSPMITHSIIANNSARFGGGIRCYEFSDPTITSCTITGNTASSNGDGLYCFYSNPTVTNCIFWNDLPQEIHVYSSTPIVTYSNVQGGTGESWFGVGCFDTDPLFVDPDGPDDDPGTWGNNDFHLAANSPCIDTGDTSSDFGLEPEPDGGRVNMGAYGNTSEAATKGWLCIEDYEIVSRTRVGRTVFDYELSIVITNESDTAATGVVANLLSVPGNATIIDDDVDVGSLAAGEMVISVDTFTLRVDRSVPLSPLAISWLVTYSQGGMSRESEFTSVLLPAGLEPTDEPDEPDDPDSPTGLDVAPLHDQLITPATGRTGQQVDPCHPRWR